MPIDPTGWPSPIHGFTYWYRKSNEYEREVYEIADGYAALHGSGFQTDLMMLSDPQYQLAIRNQQFAERRAGTFGLAAVVRMLEASMAETQKLNELLAQLLAEGKS